MNESHCKYKVADIFERLIEIEYRDGKLYAKLSKLFYHVPEISTFWVELAKEDILHMNTLQEIQKSLIEGPLLSPSEKQI